MMLSSLAFFTIVGKWMICISSNPMKEFPAQRNPQMLLLVLIISTRSSKVETNQVFNGWSSSSTSNSTCRWEEGASPAALRLVAAICALAWLSRFIWRCLSSLGIGCVSWLVYVVLWFVC